MYLTQYYLDRILGEQLIVHIDPASIDLYMGSKRPMTKKIEKKLIRLRVPFRKQIISLLHRIHPFLIPQAPFSKAIPIEDHGNYQKTINAIENRYNLMRTHWYRQLMNDLGTYGISRHKEIEMRSEEQIITFFREYVFDLVDSMEARGYQQEKCADTGTVMVGPDGRLIKSSSGMHRFHVARQLGIKPFPVKIMGVHRRFFTHYNKEKSCSDRVQCLAELIREVEQKHR